MKNSTSEAASNPLAQAFTPWALLRFAFPTIFMMVFSGIYTIVDTIFVARFVSTSALSSINIVTPVINLIVGIGTMLSTGGSAIIARKMGDEQNRQARQDFTLITLTGFVVGIAIAMLGLASLGPLIRGLGASSLLFPYARDYLSTLLPFAPANMLQILFASLFVTAGKPGLGMGLGIASGLFNALFDYIFIVPCGMGIRGAALVTGMAYLIPTITGIVFFACKRPCILQSHISVSGCWAKAVSTAPPKW